MKNQSVILRKGEAGEPEVKKKRFRNENWIEMSIPEFEFDFKLKVNEAREKGFKVVGMTEKEMEFKKAEPLPLTPEGIFLAAYEKTWSKINHDQRDNLQMVAERLLTRIKDKKTESWEFRSVKNMEVFLSGCIKNQQIDTQQNHGEALKISLSEVVEEIPDWKRIPRIDLFDDIRGAKKAGTKKDLFTEDEKNLITWHLEEEQTLRQIAKHTGQARMTIKRQLSKIFRQIAKLPIRGLYGITETDGHSRPVHCEDPASRPLVTRIGLLRRYRRTKDVRWLDKYSEHVERVLEQHSCRCLNGDHGMVAADSRQLAVAPVVGTRTSITDRGRLNQSMVNLYHQTPFNGLTLSSLTV